MRRVNPTSRLIALSVAIAFSRCATVDFTQYQGINLPALELSHLGMRTFVRLVATSEL